MFAYVSRFLVGSRCDFRNPGKSFGFSLTDPKRPRTRTVKQESRRSGGYPTRLFGKQRRHVQPLETPSPTPTQRPRNESACRGSAGTSRTENRPGSADGNRWTSSFTNQFGIRRRTKCRPRRHARVRPGRFVLSRPGWWHDREPRSVVAVRHAAFPGRPNRNGVFPRR